MSTSRRMKTMTYGELKSRARDRFSYILLGCPNFPPSTGTTTWSAFEKQVGFIDSMIEQTESEEGKQWLRVCLQEVRQSWKAYEVGDLSKGRKLIQLAKEHFDNAFVKKPIAPRFIVGDSGSASDADKGFPC